MARSIKKLADGDNSSGEKRNANAAPYPAEWFCFKPEKETVYQKQKRVLVPRFSQLAGKVAADGAPLYCRWGRRPGHDE